MEKRVSDESVAVFASDNRVLPERQQTGLIWIDMALDLQDARAALAESEAGGDDNILKELRALVVKCNKKNVDQACKIERLEKRVSPDETAWVLEFENASELEQRLALDLQDTRREIDDERFDIELRNESDNESFQVLCEIMCLHFDDPEAAAGACPVEMPDMIRTVRDWFAATRTTLAKKVEEVERLETQKASSLDRDFLGSLVRMAWVEWANEQDNPKPSWLVPWSKLEECDKEADRQIGEKVASICVSPELVRAEQKIERLEAQLDATALDLQGAATEAHEGSKKIERLEAQNADLLEAHDCLMVARAKVEPIRTALAAAPKESEDGEAS